MSEQTFSYDVFISHSAKDKDAARDLAERLKSDGLHVWFDEWEIKPGDMIGLKIQRGLEQSRTLLLIMSANASESEWVTFESQTVLFNDPTNQQRRLIPLRLDNAELKETLKQFAYLDWRRKSKDQYEKLLTACRPLISIAQPTAMPQEHTGSCQADKDKALSHKTFKGHSNAVNGVAVTADGGWVVSGSSDNTIRMWDEET